MADGVITIPEYYKRYINSAVDLTFSPKQCCPFHKEDTPSFSYSSQRESWRCFGSCKVGGDVIELHKINFKLSNRSEAKAHLYKMLNIVEAISFKQKEVRVNEMAVQERLIYTKAVQSAVTPGDWLALDYIMSIYPLDYTQLEVYINTRGDI